ncbi:MAG: D-glycero-beta-D-manno-heptose 1,7-bisphosphate 7-phosphatase [Gammaproteobacteria bacterium]|nr:D-glycero-beta-D-manno-heptose 1,7-bisphosphate 7-phosphatase [Gammaproteobacteria bacterium]
MTRKIAIKEGMKRIKAIILDRDGIINIDKGYVHNIEDFEFVEYIFEVLQQFQKLGYRLFIVTNQSGIAKGYYTEADFIKLNNHMIGEFKNNAIKIEKIVYCPHHPAGIREEYSIQCNCRKPESGMIEEILMEYEIDIDNSYMIGDSERDIIAGNNVGLKSVLISRKDNTKSKADFIYNDIITFADSILN